MSFDRLRMLAPERAPGWTKCSRNLTLPWGGATVQFTGFDVSADQFPRQKRPDREFVVHDAVEPFPIKYHDGFDLVHIRFLSYGIQADRLPDFVDSVLQILR